MSDSAIRVEHLSTIYKLRGVPVMNIGSRQTGRKRGVNVIDVDYDREAIVAGIEKYLSNGTYQSDPIYGDGHAGERIAELLATRPPHIEKRLSY